MAVPYSRCKNVVKYITLRGNAIEAPWVHGNNAEDAAGAPCKCQTQPRRSHCDLTVLPRHSHSAAMAIVWIEFPPLSFQNAVPRSSVAFYGDPTALLAIVLRSPRRSTILRRPWERHHNGTGVLLTWHMTLHGSAVTCTICFNFRFNQI